MSSNTIFSLDRKAINELKGYLASVRKQLHDNSKRVAQIEVEGSEILSRRLEHRTSLNGGLVVADLKELGAAAHFFFKREGRYSKKNCFITKSSQFNTRGPRYTVASDPTIEFPEKLGIYRDDIFDVLQLISQHKLSNFGSRQLSLASLLDYLKNAVVTVFNAYTQREKYTVDQSFEDEYLKLRDALQTLACSTVFCFYKSLCGDMTEEDFDYLRHSNYQIVMSALIRLDREYKEYELSSKSLVRPEASDPKRILATANLIVRSSLRPDLLVGLPSGGTELACLCKAFYDHLGHNTCLVLLPVSIHSLKNDLHISADAESVIESRLPSMSGVSDAKNVLVVDDNSSTGKTLQLVVDSLQRFSDNPSIQVGVAEADTIRTALDFVQMKRDKVAAPSVFRFSSGVLPISKSIQPKRDLKEVAEQLDLVRYYRNKLNNTISTIKRVKYDAFISCVRNPLNGQSLKDPHAIKSFRDTELSNFFACTVTFKGRLFPSVEHAYQWAKFDFRNLVLTRKQEQTLQYRLKARGVNYDVHQYPIRGLFESRSHGAGTVKVCAKALREFGYARPDWDVIKFNVMIDLLLQKFADPHLHLVLQKTEDANLIEGNDWMDTFWGFDINAQRGRNFLGRILMSIRSKRHA